MSRSINKGPGCSFYIRLLIIVLQLIYRKKTSSALKDYFRKSQGQLTLNVSFYVRLSMIIIQSIYGKNILKFTVLYRHDTELRSHSGCDDSNVKVYIKRPQS